MNLKAGYQIYFTCCFAPKVSETFYGIKSIIKLFQIDFRRFMGRCLVLLNRVKFSSHMINSPFGGFLSLLISIFRHGPRVG